MSVAPGIKLTHNTWIDIGKDFGIVPFVLFIAVTAMHLFYLTVVVLRTSIERSKKYLLSVVIGGAIPLLAIEPVFTSDKTFVAYLFFVFGLVAQCYGSLKKAERMAITTKKSDAIQNAEEGATRFEVFV